LTWLTIVTVRVDKTQLGRPGIAQVLAGIELAILLVRRNETCLKLD
jgi:hypothetical protein